MTELKVANLQCDSPHTIPDWITITGIWECWFGGEGKPEHPEKANTEPTWNQATVGILLHLACTYTVPPLHSVSRLFSFQLEGVIDSYFYFSFWLV